MEYLFILAILIAFFIFALIMLINTSRARKVAKQEHKRQVQARNASLSSGFAHFYGLPIPEKTFCTIYSTPESIQILVQYVSSLGGAVAGATLYGPIGAIIGGRTKVRILIRTRVT